MAVIKIENFGGELPSVSPRALPPNAAQENRNLFMGVAEFRPLKADAVVGASVTAAKSLYRIDATQPWITATIERSYVRGQINGDTNKRTYYTVNDGASPPMVMDVTGEVRRLGVPAPDKPAVVHTPVSQVTWEQASDFVLGEGANSIRRTIAAHRMPGGATQHYQGTTILAGPYSSHGLLFPNNVAVPSSIQAQHWCLVGQMSAELAATVKLAEGLGAVASGGSVFLPLPCLPYKFQLNTATASPALAALKGPDGSTALLNENMILTITNAADVILDPDEYAASERRELDAIAQEFARLMTATLPAVPVRPTAPVKPTTAPYVFGGGA